MADGALYRFRLSRSQPELTYRLTPDALVWGEARDARLPLADIRMIRIYSSPGARGVPGFRRCTVWPRHGRARVLSTLHHVGRGRFEDRLPTFEPFVAIAGFTAADRRTSASFRSGMPPVLWTLWLVILVAVAILAPLLALLFLGLLFDAIGKVSTAGWSAVPVGAVVGILSAAVGACSAGAGAVRLTRFIGRNRPRRFDPRVAPA